MLQSEEMSRFMSGRFGHVLGVGTQRIGKYKAHIGGTVVKPADKGHATGAAAVPVRPVAANGDFRHDPVREDPRVDRRHIDIERCVVFGHLGPDALDCREFAGTEGRPIAVLIESGSDHVEVAAPGGHRIAVEIQDEFGRRAGWLLSCGKLVSGLLAAKSAAGACITGI